MNIGTCDHAVITSPQQDLHLGIHLYIDGWPLDGVRIDTRQCLLRNVPGNRRCRGLD
jgi:hypothetical protein